MSSTLRLIDVEVFKLRKRWMTWLLLSVLLVLIVVVYVLLWAVTETLTDTAGGRPIGLFGTTQLSDVRETLFLEQAVPFGLQMTQIVGTFLGVILASGSVGGEYGWDTVRPFLTAVPSRWQYITSKVVAISGMVVMGTLAGMLVALIVSALITLIAGNPDYSFVDVGYIGDSFASYGRTLLAMSPYIAMAVFFSTWGRSTMGGIGASLGVLFLETIITSLMQLAGEVPARITNVFPGANADTLMLENGLQIAIQQRQDPTLDVPVLDSPFAALVLATYVVGFLIATYVLFERRDVQP